jgi:hypothetical protein
MPRRYYFEQKDELRRSAKFPVFDWQWTLPNICLRSMSRGVSRSESSPTWYDVAPEITDNTTPFASVRNTHGLRDSFDLAIAIGSSR